MLARGRRELHEEPLFFLQGVGPAKWSVLRLIAMATLTKDWDRHVAETEELACGAGFQDLRDQIVDLAAPHGGDTVVDVGAGTGLLTLALAGSVARVWAVDISPSMCEYLRLKAAGARLENIEVIVASAVHLPFADGSADLVVSNYCLHHLNDPDKRRALAEARRVLRPGGRLVLGDMMFSLSLVDERDRRLLASKVMTIARRGPAGVVRLAKNATRVLARRWEKPVRADWWHRALVQAGFESVHVRLLEHEGGIASGYRP